MLQRSTGVDGALIVRPVKRGTMRNGAYGEGY